MLKFKAGGNGSNSSVNVPVYQPTVHISQPSGEAESTLKARKEHAESRSDVIAGVHRNASIRPISRKSSFLYHFSSVLGLDSEMTCKGMHTKMQENATKTCSQSGFSKANVIFQNVSLPLAWPTDEYFGTRQCREFNVQLLFRISDGREVLSRVHECVNRSITDVNFDESFVFPFQSPDFCIEIIVYCKRTDENASRSFVQSLSRSLGRSVSQSLKAYLKRAGSNTISASSRHYSNRDEIMEIMSRRSSKNYNTDIDADYLENYRNPDKMCALASAKFRLRNASLSGKIRTYTLESLVNPGDVNYDRLQLLPLYGNVCANILVQPSSVGMPLAEGVLDVFLTEHGLLLQRTTCRLQGAQLKGFVPEPPIVEENDKDGTVRNSSTHHKPSFVLPISQNTAVESTAFPSTLRLTFSTKPLIIGERYPPARSVLLVSDSRSAFLGWRNALTLQIADCEVWADFASATNNPHGFALNLPEFDNTTAVSLLQDTRNIDFLTGETQPYRPGRRYRTPLNADCFQSLDDAPDRRQKIEPPEQNNQPIEAVKATSRSENTKAQRYDSLDSAISTKNNSELDNLSEVLPSDGNVMPSLSTKKSATIAGNVLQDDIIRELGLKLAINSLRNAAVIRKDDSSNQQGKGMIKEINSDMGTMSGQQMQADSSSVTAVEKTKQASKNNSGILKKVHRLSITTAELPELRDTNPTVDSSPTTNTYDDEGNDFVISLRVNENDSDEFTPSIPKYSACSPNQMTLRRVETNREDGRAVTRSSSSPRYIRNPRLNSQQISHVRGGLRSDQNSAVASSTTTVSPLWSSATNSSISSYVKTPSSSLSSSSSNHEVQTARTTFSDSGSSLNTSSPSLPSSHLFENTILRSPRPKSSYASSLAPRPALRTTASFAENRQKFEDICSSRNYAPRRPSILKKCSTVSSSNQFGYDLRRTSFADRSYEPIRTTRPYRDAGTGWNTVSSAAPLYRRNLYDSCSTYSSPRDVSCASQTVFPASIPPADYATTNSTKL